MAETQQPKKDFFISRNGADAAWAEWIAWHLEKEGYTTILQDWDFQPGSNFVLDMQRAASEAVRTIAVLSPDYLAAKFTQPEWAAAFAQDPTGEKGLLIPVRVEKCDAKGLLPQIVYIELVGLDEAAARERLLQGAKGGRAKPKKSPVFPVAGKATEKKAPRFPGALPEICTIPHQRNPNFTGRVELLRDLREALDGEKSAALTQAIHGLGGVGKTQLAIEYAYRYANHYSLIWWVRSETPEALNADWEALARRMNLVSQEDRLEQGQVIEIVRGTLEARTGWLLVFDNAPNPKAIESYMPHGSAGHVVVTSRYAAWGRLARPLPVRVWQPRESVEFLLKRTGHEDEAAAGQLAEELGYLPLALEQAAAYVEHAGRSLAGYLGLFRERKLALFQHGSSGSDETVTVATTWDMSFEQARKDSSAAVDLLRLCAFLGPDDIPMEVIVQGIEHIPQPLSDALQDPLELDKAIIALRNYSLVEVDEPEPDERRLSIHRLVQAVTSDRLSEEERKAWAEAAVGVVNKAFPNDADDVRSWPVCARLGTHAVQAVKHAEKLQVGMENTARLLNELGRHSYGRAELDQAKDYYERALAIDEKVYGPEHSTVATLTNNIGTILKDQGDLAWALEWAKRALAIDEKVYGPEHPDVARDANNIGTILKAQGDLNGALKWTKRALTIDEKAYGPEHPTVAIYASNIGTILQDQGDLAGALEWTKRALAIDEKVYGPEHPTVAIRANNIGTILKAQGDLAAALEWTKRALAIDEKVYGPEHPKVAIRANNIGQILQDQRDLEGALEWAKRALAINEKVYGLEHPSVARDANNIGQILKAQGDLEGALEWTKRALAIFEKAYGKDNPSTRTVAGNLEAIKEAMK